MQQLLAIRAATLAARARMNDAAIGTHVRGGLGQIIRTTYTRKGASTVRPVSEWMPVADLAAALDRLN